MTRAPLDYSPRLLVVDDQEDVRTLLATALEIEGYDVITARDARDGLRCLQDAEFSLVITDYAMPGGTGVWMLLEAERRGLLDGVPALVVTAHHDVRDGHGFEIMRKPLDLDRFLAQVRQLVDRRKDPAHPAHPDSSLGEAVELVLYVSSSSFASAQAVRNLKASLKQLDGLRVHVTIKDLALEPLAGEEDGVCLTPTLVKRRPAPKIWIVGNLHDTDVLLGILEGAGLEPDPGSAAVN